MAGVAPVGPETEVLLPLVVVLAAVDAVVAGCADEVVVVLLPQPTSATAKIRAKATSTTAVNTAYVGLRFMRSPPIVGAQSRRRTRDGALVLPRFVRAETVLATPRGIETFIGRGF